MQIHECNNKILSSREVVLCAVNYGFRHFDVTFSEFVNAPCMYSKLKTLVLFKAVNGLKHHTDTNSF